MDYKHAPSRSWGRCRASGTKVDTMMRRVLAILAATLFGVALLASPAQANPSPPTNGGSANGNGASGQCTGAEAERPPSCHNGEGAGN